MTAPMDTTSAMIAADAKTLADRATEVAFTAAAWVSLVAFGAVGGLVLFVWGAR